MTDFMKGWKLWYDHFGNDSAEIHLLDEICDWRGKDVLDIGTGNGRLAFRIAPLCRSVTGIDVDKRLIGAASSDASNQNQDNLRFLHMDARSLEFAPASFDIVIFPWTLHSMQNQVQALKESYKVLKSGGCMVIFALWSDANYNKVVTPFLPKEPAAIDTVAYYEKPIKEVFGKIQKIVFPGKDKSPTFVFPTLNIAQEAFLFGLEEWHQIKATPDVEKSLAEILKGCSEDGAFKLIVDCALYMAEKPVLENEKSNEQLFAGKSRNC